MDNVEKILKEIQKKVEKYKSSNVNIIIDDYVECMDVWVIPKER